ncbi:hypothetical protein BDZ94DRAFT_1172253 [Collybia nuda]|uniref:Uncharacterized protein n=1 Tax=Collybia nuda TaxID=64659 RepID=A0A9P6CFL9_9AGAR|nr:hypothetical protein BDZ94DRAFT_1172253 [Collybia nuda]
MILPSSSDPTFNALPLHLQQRIDRAFTSVAQPDQKPSQNTSCETPANVVNPELGGGFIVESDIGGGFISEDVSHDSPENVTHIRMSLIPVALQNLDHPPDDEQVLSVFRNAASGWSSSSNNVDDGGVGEGLVSLEDWRTVCAVLFEHHNEEYEDDSDGGVLDDSAPPLDDDDQYLGSDGTNDDSDDEYVEGPTVSSSHRRTRGRQMKSSSSSPEPSTSGPKKITPRQKKACLDAFALFFPSVPATELAYQKIMIKDLQRIAKVLGEKIKADEMVEMLETFSTSPDKSMNLGDFERMMVTARLA